MPHGRTRTKSGLAGKREPPNLSQKQWAVGVLAESVTRRLCLCQASKATSQHIATTRSRCGKCGKCQGFRRGADSRRQVTSASRGVNVVSTVHAQPVPAAKPQGKGVSPALRLAHAGTVQDPICQQGTQLRTGTLAKHRACQVLSQIPPLWQYLPCFGGSPWHKACYASNLSTYRSSHC